jgi:hypothetical protein
LNARERKFWPERPRNYLSEAKYTIILGASCVD